MSGLPQLTVVADEEQFDSADCSDRLLVDAWISHQDSEAFAALVRRYGGLVIGVCRRQCRSTEDVEDAFQATFLVLSRDAKRLRRVESLAGWLHQVAYRTASRTRVKSQSMEVLIEEPLDPHDSLTAIAHRHHLRILDEELQRLPEAYRSAIVLHYFEGYSYDQTAEILKTTEPAIRGRLQRARQKLHRRLICRGVSLSLACAALSTVDAAETVHAELVNQTVSNVLQSGAGGTVEPSLESLLASESSVMLSPSILGVACAGTLTLAGFLMAQVGAGQTGNQASNADRTNVTLPGQAEPQAAGTIKAVAGQKSDPFGVDPAGAESQADDPFGGSSSTADPFNEDPSDPFGTNPFQNRGKATIAKASQDPLVAAPPDASKKRAAPAGKQIPWATAHPEVYAEIEKSLAEPASFDFFEEPLEDALQQLGETHQVPILIDRIALEEIGLSAEEPTSLQVENVSLESGLNLLLREFELTYTIDDEHLQVTTVEADEANHQLLRVYWVQDAGLQASEGSVELLQAMIDPDSWSRLGGPGEITILGAPNENASGFAIRTSYRTHRKIESFLASIQAGTQQPLTGSVGDTRPPIKRETEEPDEMMDMEMMMGGMMESGE